MRAMILAAGHGRRMRHLTIDTPKPLLPLKKKPIIVYHLESFAGAGIKDVVINLGHLGHKIQTLLGNGNSFGLNIEYSLEDPPLETGGGIVKALPLLGKDPFLVVSGDILTDFPFKELQKLPNDTLSLAHLILVDNPPHNKKGDYTLLPPNIIAREGGPLYNFGGIGVYRPELFKECPEGHFPLPMLFDKYMSQGLITGSYYGGRWHNIGTPEQLDELEQSQSIAVK